MKFKIGDKAHKPKGYKFNCIIVAVYYNLKNEIRLVGENTDGLQHIFNENQLEHESK